MKNNFSKASSGSVSGTAKVKMPATILQILVGFNF